MWMPQSLPIGRSATTLGGSNRTQGSLGGDHDLSGYALLGGASDLESMGIGQGYFLRINIKSQQLQDIKVERRRDQGSFMGFGN